LSRFLVRYYCYMMRRMDIRKIPQGIPIRKEPARSMPSEVEKTGMKMVPIIAIMPAI
jgi:hypothetical protein